MGCNSSRDLGLSEEEVKDLQNETGFSRRRINRLIDRFRSLDKGNLGYLTKHDFYQIHDLALNPVAERIVGMFFKNGSDKVYFQDFVRCFAPFRPVKDIKKSKEISRIGPGEFLRKENINSRNSKLRVLFNLVDVNGDGQFGKEEIHDLLVLMVGTEVSDAQLGFIAERVIQEADEDGDNVISFQEFQRVTRALDVEGVMSINSLA